MIIFFKFIGDLIKKIIISIVFPITEAMVNVKWGGVWNMFFKHPGFKTNVFYKSYWYRHWYKMNSDIPITLKIKGVPCFPHGEMGVFISSNAEIGKNCVIFQHVTIGSNTLKGSNVGSPVIGDNCYIGAGAKIIGNVKIGNNSRIGANACVYKDLPDNSVAVCSPTRIIIKEEALDNNFYTIDGRVFNFEKGCWS